MLPLQILLMALAGYTSCLCTVAESKTPLYIGGLFSLSERDGWSRFFGYSALVGAQRAVEDINNRSDVLSNYTLVLHVADTEADISVALDKLYDMLYNPPVKVIIYGPVMVPVTQVLAGVTGRWNLIEMSYTAGPEMHDRALYPHVYHILTAIAGFAAAQIKLVHIFGWNKIGTLHQTKDSRGVIDEFQRLATGSSTQYAIVAESFYTDPFQALKRLQEKDVRIIVSNFAEDVAFKVFCGIYQLDMYGPNYVWIIPGFFADGWWQKLDNGVACSPAELKLAGEGYLAITFMFYGTETEAGACGKTPQEFREEIGEQVGLNISTLGGDLYAASYDAIWALALALQDAEGTLNRSLDTYYYGDEEFALAMGRSILELGFAGMSGPVYFSKGGDRIGYLKIEQNIDGQEVQVATYSAITDSMSWWLPTEALWYYSGGKPPFDSDITLTVELLQGTPVALVGAMSVFAAMGMALAVMFVTFNIWKRKHRQIKMSSPKVNNIIAFGILLAYMSVVLLGVDRSIVDNAALLTICRLRSWIIPMAFTLAFGGMFTKMWRVYSIVIANKTKRKVIKDKILFAIIVVLLVVDLAILIPWQIIDPMIIQENRVPIVQTEQDLAAHERRQLVYVICTSNNNTLWTMAMLVYKAFVVVFGAFLAWSTRNIQVSGLNDSYYVGLSIYNTVICCVVAVPLSMLNVSSPAVTFALVSGFLILCITASLCMLFFPKVVAVFRKNAVEKETFTGTHTKIAPLSTAGDGRDMATTSVVGESSSQAAP